MVATTFGFAAFLGFLLLATNLAVALWVRSAATAIGFDETRRLALSGPSCAARAVGSADRIRARLGTWWDQVDADARCASDVVTLTVHASRGRSVAPAAVDSFDRTFTVRIEVER